MHALVTGGAGFIGSHLVDRLLREKWQVTVVDNFDPYYDRSLKERNIAKQFKSTAYFLKEIDICDFERLKTELYGDYDVIVHLAAKAGVRPSIQDPVAYQRVNVQGTQNLLEFAKEKKIKQFIFASSSSVYGINPNTPWREDGQVLLPISPYAATKVTGELLGHVYSHLYGIRFLALRFFTVYGPRQRPDLAINKFIRLILAGKPIQVFGDGNTFRDYTFISDIVQGIFSAIHYTKTQYEVINLGNNQVVTLNRLIQALEDELQIPVMKEYLPEQPGDVPRTYADISKAGKLLDYHPSTGLVSGIHQFAQWFKSLSAG